MMTTMSYFTYFKKAIDLQTVTDILTTFETKQNHMNVARSAVDHTPTGSDTPLQYTYYL